MVSCQQQTYIHAQTSRGAALGEGVVPGPKGLRHALHAHAVEVLERVRWLCRENGLVGGRGAFALPLGAFATFARWLSGRRLRLGLELQLRKAQGAATARTVRRCHYGARRFCYSGRWLGLVGLFTCLVR